MNNDYEVRGEVTAIFLNSKKYGKLELIISTSKLERANEFVNSWYPWWSDKSQTFYALGNKPKSKGERGIVYLHRFITMCPDGMQVDHRNNNGLLNTDENLSIVTKQENMQNRRGAAGHNKYSGLRGVGYHKPTGLWTPYIVVDRRKIHLGYFSDINEAERVVKEARAKYMPNSKEALSS